METIIVNIDSKKELPFFFQLIKKMGYKSRVLNEEEKEDIALLKLMQERKNEDNVPVRVTHQKLDKLIKE